jgi:DNA-binding MarR family transcriptional regulator
MAEPDSIDRHIAHWSRELPDLDPELEGIVTRMQKLVARLRRTKEASLAAHGLKEWEYDVLHHLRAVGPPYQVAPSLLAEWLGTHPATLTSRLDRLEQAGHITRVHDPADRRRLLVALTGAGQERWQAAMGELGRTELELLGVLDPHDRTALAGLLRRVTSAVEADGPPLVRDWPGSERAGQAGGGTSGGGGTSRDGMSGRE